jgi:hypothetical protein
LQLCYHAQKWSEKDMEGIGCGHVCGINHNYVRSY